MDADDLMLGNRLEEQVTFLKRNLDYGMVGGWYKITDESGHLLNTSRTPQEHEFLRLGLTFRNVYFS